MNFNTPIDQRPFSKQSQFIHDFFQENNIPFDKLDYNMHLAKQFLPMHPSQRKDIEFYINALEELYNLKPANSEFWPHAESFIKSYPYDSAFTSFPHSHVSVCNLPFVICEKRCLYLSNHWKMRHIMESFFSSD